jgi:hypothetical protein
MKDATTRGHAVESPALAGIVPSPGPVQLGNIETEPTSSLPRDHPTWQRDVLAVSARVRATLAGLRPLAIRVLSFWDHVTRVISIGSRSVEIDPSGSYRLR